MDEQSTIVARIRKSLAKMKRRDEKMRSTEPWDDTIIEENTRKLQEIVDEIGWPTISVFGKESAMQAWDIVQHVKPNSAFHSHCLELMKQCTEGDVEKSWIAHLEDRIRVNNGKPQLYGTEFRRNADGHFEPFPIESVTKLDERRQAMHMESYSAYLQKLNKQGFSTASSA